MRTFSTGGSTYFFDFKIYGFAAPPVPPADDPYVVLGLPRSATPREISKRYRQLAREHHPDVEGGDAAKMTRINNAYNALKEQS